MRISDWSSDVCSSDLEAAAEEGHGDLDRLLEILVLEIEAVARRRPLLLVVEDLHWIDPNSLELLHRLSLRDRKSVVYGKSVSVSVDTGGRRNIKKKHKHHPTPTSCHSIN